MKEIKFLAIARRSDKAILCHRIHSNDKSYDYIANVQRVLNSPGWASVMTDKLSLDDGGNMFYVLIDEVSAAAGPAAEWGARIGSAHHSSAEVRPPRRRLNTPRPPLRPPPFSTSQMRSKGACTSPSPPRATRAGTFTRPATATPAVSSEVRTVEVHGGRSSGIACRPDSENTKVDCLF